MSEVNPATTIIPIPPATSFFIFSQSNRFHFTFFLFFSIDFKITFRFAFENLDEREIFILIFFIDIFLSHRKVFCFRCSSGTLNITLSCTFPSVDFLFPFLLMRNVEETMKTKSSREIPRRRTSWVKFLNVYVSITLPSFSLL